MSRCIWRNIAWIFTETLIDIFAEIANIVCCLNCSLVATLCQIHASLLAICVVVSPTNMIEVGQFVNDSLHFLTVVRVIKGEVTNVDVLVPVSWVNISIC